jgi:hypothetical protein
MFHVLSELFDPPIINCPKNSSPAALHFVRNFQPAANNTRVLPLDQGMLDNERAVNNN